MPLKGRVISLLELQPKGSFMARAGSLRAGVQCPSTFLWPALLSACHYCVVDTLQEGVAPKPVEGAQDPGFTVGSGKWGETLRLSQNSAWADHKQVRPGGPECNFSFFPKCVILSQSLLFWFSQPGSHNVLLAVLELVL